MSSNLLTEIQKTEGEIKALAVCVITPMYNSSETILRSLLSLESQTTLPDQVILVDDGSTDNTVEIVNNYTTSLNITIIEQSNQGPSVARNAGIQAAKEELIMFLDSDDSWEENKVELQLNLYKELKNAGHSVGIIDTFEKTSYTNGNTELVQRVKNGKEFDAFVYKNVINGTSTVMAPKSVLEQFGGFDSDLKYAEDRWLWTQISKEYEVFTVPKVLSTRFIASGNITSNPSKYYPYKKEYIKKYLGRFGGDLSAKQRRIFVFNNHDEFLCNFYNLKDHENTQKAFKEMLNYSWLALFFRKGNPFVKYLIAKVKSR